MNTKHAFSASKTLAIAQSLYERHKLITYPRTSSRFLPNSSRPMVAALIKYVSIRKLRLLNRSCSKILFLKFYEFRTVVVLLVNYFCLLNYYRQFTQAPKNKHFDVSKILEVNKALVLRNSAIVFNETKVTDHHALLPTLNADWQNLASKLDEKEIIVFSAITKRFLSTYECKIA